MLADPLAVGGASLPQRQGAIRHSPICVGLDAAGASTEVCGQVAVGISTSGVTEKHTPRGNRRMRPPYSAVSGIVLKDFGEGRRWSVYSVTVYSSGVVLELLELVVEA